MLYSESVSEIFDALPGRRGVLLCHGSAVPRIFVFSDGRMYYEPNKPNYPLVIVLLLIAGIFWPLVILFAVFVPLTFLLMDKMGQLHPKDDDEMDPEEDTYL